MSDQNLRDAQLKNVEANDFFHMEQKNFYEIILSDPRT